MTSQPSGSRIPAELGYHERLRTPWWWYLGGVAVAVLLGAEFAFAVSGPITWIPLLVLVPVCVLVVWRLSAGSISVSQSQLITPAGSVDLADVEQAIGLSPEELRRLVGRHSDPIAVVYVRSWVGPGVQLVLNSSTTQRNVDSPDLPVPYWVVSTRHPDRLLKALQAEHVPTL